VMVSLAIPSDIAFVILTVVTITAAIMALHAKELIYGAVSLAVSFIGIAGFFALLDAPYLAMLQIAIYVGAIVVLILFTIMLVRRDQAPEIDEQTNSESPVGLWLAGLLALAISGVVALAGASLPTGEPPANLQVSDLGPVLTSQYPVPLIVLALLLSASLLGALVLAKVER